MKRPSARSRPWPRWPALLGLLLALPVVGAPPAAPLRYRRVYVPQEDLDQQVRGLLPLKREEFERRMALASANNTPLQSARVRIEAAAYRARLEGDALVGGTAQLAIAAGPEETVPLLLEPCNLAMQSAAWQGPTRRPARMGNDPQGRLTCLVDRGGTLEFEWSLAGRRDDPQGLAFALELPPAPINQLEVELPAGMRLTADRGLVREPKSGGQAWSIDAGGATQLNLRISTQPVQPTGQPRAMWKDRTTYTVQRGTVEVEATLEIDALGGSPQLTLELDGPLQLLSVRRGGQPLAWSPLPAGAGPPRVLVNLPAALDDKSQPLELSGSAPWPSETTFRLPKVRVVDALWQEGRASVLAADSLELVATALTGSRQTAFSPGAAAQASDQWQFQYSAPDGAIEVAAPEVPPPLLETSALRLQFDAAQVVGTWIGEISTSGGKRFSIDAVIPRAWIVDAVEVLPADMLDDRSLQASGSGGQSLHLALRRPLSEGRSVQVTVRAHRRRPTLDQRLPDDLIALVRCADVRSARRLVSLQAIDPATQIVLSGDESLRRFDPATLSPADLRLFEGSPGTLVFELDQAADSLVARLAQTSPRYRADFLVRAELTPSEVRQLLRVQCTPVASSLGQIVVHCSPAPPDSVQWRIVGEDARELTARRLEPPAAQADEALFELTLLRPRQSVFELEAEFTHPRPSTRPIALAWVPAASVQAGELELHATAGLPLSIDAPALQPLPPRVDARRIGGTLRGRYRYEPGRSASPRAAVSPSAAARHSLWANSLRLVSHISANGTAQHEAEILLHSAGRDRLTVNLPPTAGDVQAQVDPPASGAGGVLAPNPTGEYAISLPAGAPRATVRLSYATKHPPLGWRPWGTIDVIAPRLDIPVLASDLRVQTAAGLQVAPGQALAGRTVRVFSPAVIAAWSWCLALASAALSVRLGTGRQSWWMLAAGMAGAAAVLLSSQYAPLATGLCLGIVAGGAASLIRPRGALSPQNLPIESAAPPSRSSLLRPAGLGLLLAAIGLASLVGAEPATDSPAQGPALRRVVIPVDEQRQQVGDYVFLEPELYDALVQLTDRAASDAPAWLLTQGAYRASLGAGRGDASSRIEELSLSLELETMHPAATVELPFKRSEIHLVEGRSKLDGEAMVPDWAADGQRLRFVVPQLGKHRLEIAFAALPQPNDAVPKDAQPAGVPPGNAAAPIEFDVPPIALSRLSLPGGAGAMRAVSARGTSSGDPTGEPSGERSIFLGPTSRIVLQPPADAAAQGPPRVEVEQLFLWKIRPGSVVAEGKLRVRPLGGTLRGVALEIDSRLRPLPPAEGTIVATQQVEEGPTTSILHLEFAEPAAAEIVVPVALLWNDSSGVGNFALPKIAVRADKLSRAWTAVSLAAGLQWKSPPQPRPADPTPAAFAVAWGEPLVGSVLALDDSQPAPLLGTQPSEPRIAAVQTLECSLSQRSAWVRLSAALSQIPPHQFEHRLEVAAGLQLREVTVHEGQRVVPSRWRQVSANASAGNTVVVSLSQSPAADQRIEVVGQTALARGQRTLAVPMVEYVGAADNAFTLRVFRQSDVQLTLAANEQTWASQSAPELGRQTVRLGRLAAELVRREGGNRAAQIPTVTLSPNQPQVTGWLLTRLVPGQQEWTVQIDCLASVRSGTLDVLRLELPPAMAGPLTISPAVEHVLSTVPGQTAQVLTIHPQRAIQGELRLTIRAPLRGATHQAAALPTITLLGQSRVRRLAALPQQAGSERLAWETSGLQAIAATSLELPAELVPAGSELFELIAPRASAIAQVRGTIRAAPQVVLADHRVALDSRGQLAGNSTFDLNPGGARHVDLAVPPGVRLLFAEIEGIPAQLVERGAGRWRLATLSDRLPQRLAVHYDGSVRGPSAAVSAPVLEAAPAQRTLWTVSLPSGRTIDRGAGRLLTADVEQVERLEQAAVVLEAIATLGTGDTSPAVLSDSFAAWHARLIEVRQAIVPVEAESSQLAKSLAVRIDEASVRANAARDRLAAAGIALPAADAGGGSDRQVITGPRAVRLSFAGDRTRLRLSAPPAQSYVADLRLLRAGAIAAAAAILAWLLANGAVQSWLARHAPFAIALAGALWLVAGTAPCAGWLAIVLAAWLAVRWPWRRSSGEPLSSIFRRPA